ncbi:hypothetical protein B7494_g4565 [Chlorociboria aeruginascens]|nr:hypothetical protein B7494_g4565 [Chlorociboria aeruginascens]
MPGRQQIRGKKILAKDVNSTVKVRLLQDVPRFGREGTILPVAAGLMRNNFFPRKMAEYVTAAKLKELRKNDLPLERDYLFMNNRAAPKEELPEVDMASIEEGLQTPILRQYSAPPAEPIDLELLSPERSTKLLSMILPLNLNFYRTPITIIQAPAQKMSPSISAGASLSAAASQGKEIKRIQTTDIYGSVTTADIVANLKAILAEDEEGARVVLSPEDISFVEDMEEKDRVKRLGIFEIDIMTSHSITDCQSVNMGATDVLSRKSGVIVGDDVLKLFNYAQEHKFAIPAINVTSSSTVVASLEAARDAKAPIILQMSQGGAAYFAGKGVANGNQEASIAGGIAAAHYIRAVAPAYGIPVVLHTDHCAKKLLPWLDGLLDADEKYFKEHGEPLFSSHMIDLSEEEVDFNIKTTAKYLKRAAPMKQWLEMEIGITGGEEDGVNNEDVDNNSLYTQPEDILAIYKALSPISPYFSIAAGFGNVHGVYKPGNVKLHPELLGKHQKYVKDAIGAKEDKPVFLVFHGGSGSSKQEYLDAISYGVVKVNLDTDLQYAYLTGIRDYVLKKKDYIMSQVGNPDGAEKPNKKSYDPRVWVREGEKTMSARIAEGLKDFNTAGQL